MPANIYLGNKTALEMLNVHDLVIDDEVSHRFKCVHCMTDTNSKNTV